MAGSNLMLPGQPAPQVNLGSLGVEIETETQLKALGGNYLGQSVQPAPHSNANTMLADAADAMEAGLATLLNASRLLSRGRGMDPKRQVFGRQGASELKDDTSATGDEDTPDAVVKRVTAFLELTREMGGGGGGNGGDGQGGQQQRQTVLEAKHGAASKKTDALLSALQGIQMGVLPQGGTTREAAIRAALAAFDGDPEQQLMALAGIRVELNAGGDFADALGRVQDEFTSGISGDQMQKLASNAAIALQLVKLRQREEAGASGSLRESMSHDARNVDPDRTSEGLSELLARVKGKPLQEVFKSQMEAVGGELGLHESAAMDRGHLKAILTEIQMIKLLNSIYDAAAELIDNSGAAGSERFDIKSVMSFTLGFISAPAPDESTAVSALNDFFFQAIPSAGAAPFASSTAAMAA